MCELITERNIDIENIRKRALYLDEIGFVLETQLKNYGNILWVERKDTKLELHYIDEKDLI